MTLVLVFAAGAWVTRAGKIDPLTAAQNSRIKFKSTESGQENVHQLSDEEFAQAQAVLSNDRRTAEDGVKVLFLGNSQTLAIMDEQPGDLTTPQWFQVLLSRQSSRTVPRERVILGAEPNMTMPEVLIKLLAAGEQLPRQCDILLEAVVLEEYRGLGIREDLARTIETEGIKDKLTALLQRNPDLSAAATSLAAVAHPTEDKAGMGARSEASFGQRLERRAQSWTERNELFARRSDLQAQIGIQYSILRNRILRIDSATVRPVPEASYRASLELLELALRYARSKEIQVALYLAPMRPVQPNPNLPADVLKFRRDVPEICRRYGAVCLDYVDLVPEQLWTNYSDDPANVGGQRDFAHFTGAAHKLVAETLIKDLSPQFKLWEKQQRVAQR